MVRLLDGVELRAARKLLRNDKATRLSKLHVSLGRRQAQSAAWDAQVVVLDKVALVRHSGMRLPRHLSRNPSRKLVEVASRTCQNRINAAVKTLEHLLAQSWLAICRLISHRAAWSI